MSEHNDIANATLANAADGLTISDDASPVQHMALSFKTSAWRVPPPRDLGVAPEHPPRRDLQRADCASSFRPLKLPNPIHD